MEDNSYKTFDEDSWNNGSNNDKILDLLRNVGYIKEKAKVEI